MLGFNDQDQFSLSTGQQIDAGVGMVKIHDIEFGDESPWSGFSMLQLQSCFIVLWCEAEARGRNIVI